MSQNHSVRFCLTSASRTENMIYPWESVRCRFFLCLFSCFVYLFSPIPPLLGHVALCNQGFITLQPFRMKLCGVCSPALHPAIRCPHESFMSHSSAILSSLSSSQHFFVEQPDQYHCLPLITSHYTALVHVSQGPWTEKHVPFLCLLDANFGSSHLSVLFVFCIFVGCFLFFYPVCCSCLPTDTILSGFF